MAINIDGRLINLRRAITPLKFIFGKNAKRYENGDFNVCIRGNAAVIKGFTPKRIAVIGGLGMGDQLVMTPGIRFIKELFPSSNITFHVLKEYLPLFKGLDFIDRLFPIQLKEQKSWGSYSFELQEALKDNEYDLILFNMCSQKIWSKYFLSLNNTITLAGANTLLPLFSFKEFPGLNYEVYSQTKGGSIAYVGYLWGILPLAAIKGGLKWLPPVSEIKEKVRPQISREILNNESKKVSDIFNTLKGRKTIYFNPFAKLDKMFTEENSANLIRKLSEGFPEHEILVNCGTDTKIRVLESMKERTEKEMAKDIMKMSGDSKRVRLLPSLNLEELVQMMYKSSFILTFDTGTSHIAYSNLFMDKPCLVMYCDEGSKIEWAVEGKNIHTMVADKINKYSLSKKNEINIPIHEIISEIRKIVD